MVSLPSVACFRLLIEPAPPCWYTPRNDVQLPFLQGVGLDAMNSGPQPVVGMTDIYHEPGVVRARDPVPADALDRHGAHRDER